jgi:hypothetical protein
LNPWICADFFHIAKDIRLVFPVVGMAGRKSMSFGEAVAKAASITVTRRCEYLWFL